MRDEPRRTYPAAPLPSEPTPALPGSAEKLAVMIERAELGVQLFHPLDGDDVDRPVPLPPGRLFFRACEGRRAMSGGGAAMVF